MPTKTKEQQERHNAARRRKTQEIKQKRLVNKLRVQKCRANKKAEEAAAAMSNNNENPPETPRAGANTPRVGANPQVANVSGIDPLLQGDIQLAESLANAIGTQVARAIKERRQGILQADEARHRLEQQAEDARHRRELERMEFRASLSP